MTYPCPYCKEPIEVNPEAIYTGCQGCGREYLTDELPVIHQLQQEAQERRESKREIEEVLRDQNRRRKPGGGDDGLAMTWDIVMGDDTIVKTDKNSFGFPAKPRGKRIEKATEFISVRGLPLEMDSEQIREAIRRKLQEHYGY